MPLDLEALKAGARAKRKSFTERLRVAENITRESFRIKALLVGDSGSGKSTSAITAPGRKLVFEADKRSESLAGFPDIEVLDCDDWDSVTDAVEELWEQVRHGSFVYDTVIFDSLTSLGRLAMNWSLELKNKKGEVTARGLGGVPAEQHYYPQMYALSQLCLTTIPLPCHVIFTGHLDIYEDKILKTLDIYPKVTGKIRTEVSSWFNETYLCTRSKGKYYWVTAPFQRYAFLKSAINQLGRYWTDDIELDFEKPPTGFSKILNLRFGKENSKTAQAQATTDKPKGV
jgi:hypothetical protein